MKFIQVLTEQQAHELVSMMPQIIAVDTEFVPGNPRTTQLTSVIVADSDRAWICSPHLLPILSPAIRSRTVLLQDYNRCDTIILKQHHCDISDTLVYNLIDMHHLIDENADHSLGSRVMATFLDDYKIRLKGQYDNLEYQGKDGIYTYLLGIKDITALNKKGLMPFYLQIKALSDALLDTQLQGIKVDTELMRRTKDTMSAKIAEYLPKLKEEFYIETESWELEEWQKEISKRKSELGRLRVPRPNFNFDSDRQISWLVYDALESPVINKTKSGNPKTDYETLLSISEGQGRLKTLVEYKDVKTLYSTFVEGMIERTEDGRIYPSFNVSGTSTGRLSHSNPNMGNLPRSGVIRNFFVPDPGCVLIGADYAQLEVVIEANLTEDPSLLKIINEGKSKHDITAEGLGIERNAAKTLNFALQYGAGPGKVAKILGTSKAEAEDIFKRYWELYSGVRTLKEKTDKEVKEKHCVTNLAGRTRHFPVTSDKWELLKQQRQAYNFLIQGVAAECCNRSFTEFHKFLKDSGQGRTLFSVHDEIVAEVKEHFDEYAMTTLESIMEAISLQFNFKYPLKSKSYGPLLFWDKT